MDFRRGHGREELEINLIPLIDVLLVILIFLMVTTTYSKFSGIELELPTADREEKSSQPEDIDVVVTAAGQILVDRVPVAGRDVAVIAEALARAAGERKTPLVVIHADAKAAHQHVVDVMQGAAEAGYPRVSFATRSDD